MHFSYQANFLFAARLRNALCRPLHLAYLVAGGGSQGTRTQVDTDNLS